MVTSKLWVICRAKVLFWDEHYKAREYDLYHNLIASISIACRSSMPVAVSIIISFTSSSKRAPSVLYRKYNMIVYLPYTAIAFFYFFLYHELCVAQSHPRSKLPGITS